MTVTTDPDIGSIPGEGYHLGFGAKDGAGDGYDSGEGDEIAPPDPMTGINAYFYYQTNPPFQKNLIVSVTNPGTSITWPLVIKMVGETGDTEMTINWPDISGVPTEYAVLELQDTEGTTLADMRSVNHYTFSASQGTTYNFQIKAEVEEVPKCDLTIDSTTGGNVTEPGEGTFVYDYGTEVALVAAAGEGYYFVNWTGNVVSVNNTNAPTTTITMDGNYSITANFELIPPGQFVLTTSSTAGGSITIPGEGAFPYDDGTEVNLVAAPDTDYQFVIWTGDVGDIANISDATTTITMNDNYSITANFEETGGGQTDCGMATLGDFAPFGLVSVGLVAVWATKRRRNSL